MIVIASGFGENTDPAALVIGLTGVSLALSRDKKGVYYVNDGDNTLNFLH